MFNKFIIAAVFPLYFITVILADPYGIITRFVSFFPPTAPMILIVRNSLGTIETGELLIGAILVFVYVILAFILSSKLFSIGALMYSRKPTFKELLYALKK